MGNVSLSSISIECVRLMTQIKNGVLNTFDWGWILEIINVYMLQHQVLRWEIYKFFVYFICLFEVFRPTREFFTLLNMSPLPVKGCKFLPILGTYGHWAVWVFSVPHLLWHEASVYNGQPIINSLYMLGVRCECNDTVNSDRRVSICVCLSDIV